MFAIRYRYIFILILSVYSYANIMFIGGEKLFDFEINGLYLFGVLLLVVLGVWELNRLVDSRLARRKTRIHSLILLFLASVMNVFLVTFLALIALYKVVGIPIHWELGYWKLLAAFAFRINLFLNCVNAILYFMNKLKQTELETEQLKIQNIEAQFEALRNQINPHFLFNCFNVLSTLVHKDADASSKFIAQLSNVYRYLLYNQESKMVSLQEELTFVESYAYLLRTRFNENLLIENNIRTHVDWIMVAPASIQMLIENAIKHNVATKKSPLNIILEQQDDYIIIRNTLQKKEVEEISTKIGLKNIIGRYKLLSNLPVIVESTTTQFIVKLPTLRLAT